MPLYRITVVNEDFSSSDESEQRDAEQARIEAMKSVLAIGADEIVGGKRFFAAEIKIEEGQRLLDRIVVSIGRSPLKL